MRDFFGLTVAVTYICLVLVIGLLIMTTYNVMQHNHRLDRLEAQATATAKETP